MDVVMVSRCLACWGRKKKGKGPGKSRLLFGKLSMGQSECWIPRGGCPDIIIRDMRVEPMNCWSCSPYEELIYGCSATSLAAKRSRDLWVNKAWVSVQTSDPSSSSSCHWCPTTGNRPCPDGSPILRVILPNLNKVNGFVWFPCSVGKDHWLRRGGVMQEIGGVAYQIEPILGGHMNVERNNLAQSLRVLNKQILPAHGWLIWSMKYKVLHYPSNITKPTWLDSFVRALKPFDLPQWKTLKSNSHDAVNISICKSGEKHDFWVLLRRKKNVRNPEDIQPVLDTCPTCNPFTLSTDALMMRHYFAYGQRNM